MTKRTLGFIINPIAGMGGRVGLKGTDGPDAAARARALGAVPLSPERARTTLEIIVARLGDTIEIVAAPGAMGEEVARACGVVPFVLGNGGRTETTGADTENVARVMADRGVDLLLFAGGDGTARDIARAVAERVPVLGIPTGVKMHSAVFASNPRAAGELATRHLTDPLPCRQAEVMDIDEEVFRAGRVSARLYGYVRVPYDRLLVQGLKAGSSGDEASLPAIAAEVVERMGDGALYLLGPGTTIRAIAQRLGVEKTLLGVDLVCRGAIIARDATEAEILRHLDGTPARIVVTPIGGQDYLFGRGNQQLSPEVIRRVGTGHILVVATLEKLASLRGAPLRVDTGDGELDTALAGYLRVITGYRAETVCRVEA